jgi:argininosuccinate lyase
VFRESPVEAHGVVAGLVRAAIESGRSLSEFTAEELAEHSGVLGENSEEYREALTGTAALESKISEGGTAQVRVREQLAQARSVLAEAAAARAREEEEEEERACERDLDAVLSAA